MRAVDQSLQGCHVVSLRPVGGHDPLRQAAAHAGARVLALSPWRIAPRTDPAARTALREALRAPRIVFTSPSAVQAAGALQPLRARPGQRWYAVGAGTADALRRLGIADVESPQRMDSEGLLGLPSLVVAMDGDVGLVTAPGGRELIASGLARRGARVLRADVYARLPVAPAASAIARLEALPGRPWLALSSGQALQQVLAALPAPARASLLRARVAAASERLAALAREVGFEDIVVAASARPRDLIAAMTASGRLDAR